MSKDIYEDIPVVGKGQHKVVKGKATWVSAPVQTAPKELQIETEDEAILGGLASTKPVADMINKEEQAEIMALKQQQGKKLPSDIKQFDYKATAEKVMTEAKVPLKNPVLRKRLATILASFLRGVRKDFETRSVMSRPPQQGGIGFKEDVIVSVMKVANKHLQAQDFVIATVPKEEPKEVKKLKSILPKIKPFKPKQPKSKVEAYGHTPKSGNKPDTSKTIPEPEKPEPTPQKSLISRLFGHTAKPKKNDSTNKLGVDRSQTTSVVEGSVGLVQEPGDDIFNMRESTPEPSIVEADQDVGPEPKEKENKPIVVPEPDEKENKPIVVPERNVLGIDYDESSQKVHSSVSSRGALVGPVDELRYSLEDFRRLAFNPNDRIKKVISKIELLEDESFTNKLLGIRAWRESEVFNNYIKIGEEGLFTNKDIDTIITEKESKNETTLTKLEFEVVAKINTLLSV